MSVSVHHPFVLLADTGHDGTTGVPEGVAPGRGGEGAVNDPQVSAPPEVGLCP